MTKDEIIKKINTLDNHKFSLERRMLEDIINIVDRTEFRKVDSGRIIFEKTNEVVEAVNQAESYGSGPIKNALLELQNTCRKHMGGDHYTLKRNSIIAGSITAGAAVTAVTLGVALPAALFTTATVGTATIVTGTTSGAVVSGGFIATGGIIGGAATTGATVGGNYFFFRQTRRAHDNYLSVKDCIKLLNESANHKWTFPKTENETVSPPIPGLRQ